MPQAGHQAPGTTPDCSSVTGARATWTLAPNWWRGSCRWPGISLPVAASTTISFQVASFALIKAIDGYDPDRGVAFSSYAVPTIVGELKRYFRDHGWAVRVPRELHDRALQVELASERPCARRSPICSISPR